MLEILRGAFYRTLVYCEIVICISIAGQHRNISFVPDIFEAFLLHFPQYVER